MIVNNLLREFDGDALESSIVSPLIQSLTLMNKFSVLPIYFMQFLISKTTYIPYIVLTAYEDRDMVLSASNAISHMNSIIFDDNKCMKTITPAALVYPQEINMRDVVYNTSEDYWYSSSYVISGKELKNALQKKQIEFTNVQIYSDIQKRTTRVSIGWKSSVKDPSEAEILELGVILAPISDSVEAIRLPMINICKKTPSFIDIINEMIKSNPVEFKSENKEDANVLSSLTTDVKNNQMVNIDRTDAKVFKDFIKQKPENMSVWTQIDDKTDIRSVSINMGFKNRNVLLMYRYIDNLVETLSVNEE